MVKWKYIKSFTTYIYTFRVSKTYNWTVHEYKRLFWLLSFFKLRERESGKRNLSIKEKCPQSYLSYFRRGSTGESFFFYGLIDFSVFNTGLKDFGVLRVSVNLLSLTRSKMAMVRLPAMNPAQKTNILILYFRWGEGSPTSVLGSQPIIWLLSLSPSDVRRPEVTKYEHLVSPAWPTFLPNGHLFDGLILSIQIREDSISLTSSSPWAITWHKVFQEV